MRCSRVGKALLLSLFLVFPPNQHAVAECSPLILLLRWMLQEKTTLLEGIYLHTVFKNVVAVIFFSVEIISVCFNNLVFRNVYAGNFPKPKLG